MNCRKRFANLCLKPSKDLYGLPRSSILAYRSINSTIYLVRLQSHSLTVHFVFRRISSLSSVDIFFIFNPLYKSINYLALIVNGVWTSVILPSDGLTHCFGSDISFKYFSIFWTFWFLFAEIFNRSIVWSRSISLSRVSLRAFFLCYSVKFLFVRIFSISDTLQIYQ